MNDRGMKKWLAYKSLSEQESFFEEMEYEKNKEERPILLEGEADRIGSILLNYHGEEVSLRYYDDGYTHAANGVITEISKIYKFIEISGIIVSFRDIISIDEDENEKFFQ